MEKRKLSIADIREQYYKDNSDYHSYNCTDKNNHKDNINEAKHFKRTYTSWLEEEIVNILNR